ncbi:MAG: GNAT family protein [Actinomycetota bacterium]
MVPIPKLQTERLALRPFARADASDVQRLGMRREGCLRQHVMKWEKLEDLELYGILRAEWDAREPRASN